MDDFSSDQKDVLFKTIQRHIKASRARSLLDIGAGDGTLAVCLAQLVPTYVAVERRATSVQKLKQAGITVLHGTFPLKVPGTFDIVLISHAVLENTAQYPGFFTAAWGKVKRGGLLLIITFKGSKDDVSQLYEEALGWRGKKDARQYAEMVSVLKQFGALRVSRVLSTMRARDSNILAHILCAPLHLPKDRAKRCASVVARILREQFKSPEGYRLRAEHLVLAIKKNA